MLFLIVTFLLGIWQTDVSSHPQMGVIFWILTLGFIIVGIPLLVIAIAGWYNWDIFGLLAKKSKQEEKDRQTIDPEFDNW